MDLSTVQMLLGVLFLLGMSAFFSASETALLSLSRTEVKRMQRGTAAERVACRLLLRPQHLLATVLIGNLCVNVLLASICATLVGRLLFGSGDTGWFPRLLHWCWHDLSAGSIRRCGDIARTVFNVLLVTPLLIIFGEQTPKVAAYALGPVVARLIAMPLLWFGTLVAPLVWLMQRLTALFLRLLGQNADAGWQTMTNEELLAALSAGQEGGATNAQERDLLMRILGLSDIDVKEVMVPRIQVAGLSDEMTLEEAFAQAKSSRFSRMPVFHDDLDDIWALLSFTDLPKWRERPEMQMRLADFRGALEAGAGGMPVAGVYMVPETVDVDLVLSNMRKRAERFAVVVGEHGGTSGIVTLNDILEEVVGRFSGHDEDENRLQKHKGAYVADGRAHLRNLQKQFGDDFANEDGNADTVGGLVMEKLGRLPRSGDYVELAEHLIRVNRMAGRRVGTVTIVPRRENVVLTEAEEVEA